MNNSKTTQHGGTHYVSKEVQPWDIVESWQLNFFEGNVVKYMLRDKDNKVLDLQKACHYLQYLIEKQDVPKRMFYYKSLTNIRINEVYKLSDNLQLALIYFEKAIKTNDVIGYLDNLNISLKNIQDEIERDCKNVNNN